MSNEENNYMKEEDLKTELESLIREKGNLREEADNLEKEVFDIAECEEKMREAFFRALAEETWSMYKETQKNKMLEEGMKKKEQALEREYSRLMDEVSELTKDVQSTYEEKNSI